MHRRRSRDPNVADRLVIEATLCHQDPTLLHPSHMIKLIVANIGRPLQVQIRVPLDLATSIFSYEYQGQDEQLLVDIQGKEEQPMTATNLPSPRTHKASIPSPQTSASMPLSSSARRRSFTLQDDSCLDFGTPSPSLPIPYCCLWFGNEATKRLYMRGKSKNPYLRMSPKRKGSPWVLVPRLLLRPTSMWVLLSYRTNTNSRGQRLYRPR